MEGLHDIPIHDVDLSKVSDGVYEGNYETFPVSVTVEVSVKNGEITEIRLIRHINGQGKEAESVIGEVVENQTLQVDTVSGATYSSKVILLAVEDALKKGLT
ncbi:MAG: FMN-binding protein [Clostridiaceae bacterium]|nr:FMN-binding protein [Clostridiaceae bacterium]